MCTQAVPARADVYRVLADDSQAAQVLIDLIQQSRYEVNAAYYAIDGGHVSVAVLTMMRDAARRGVRVRLIVDGFASRIPAELADHLLTEGVEIREYHPLRWYRPDWINRRLHDKLLVVDGEQLVVGSRNLQDQHFGLECINFIDVDVYVRGPSVDCAREYFELLWNRPGVQPLRGSSRHPIDLLRQQPENLFRGSGPEEVPHRMEQAVARLVQGGLIRLHTGYDWSEGYPQDVPVRFLSDRAGNKRIGSMRREIMALINTAQHTLVLETPYAAFSKSMKRTLVAAQSRGVGVQLLTNSLASTDRVIAYAGYQSFKKDLLRAGVQMWEYAGLDHLHAKVMIVDGWTTVVGSYNFDARSEYMNLDVAVLAEGPFAVAEVSTAIQPHFANAYSISRTGRPVGEPNRHPGADREDLRKLRRTRLLVPVIRRFL